MPRYVLAAAESAGAELEPQALEYGGLYAVTLAGLSEDDPARLVAGWLLSDEARRAGNISGRWAYSTASPSR